MKMRLLEKFLCRKLLFAVSFIAQYMRYDVVERNCFYQSREIIKQIVAQSNAKRNTNNITIVISEIYKK